MRCETGAGIRRGGVQKDVDVGVADDAIKIAQ